MQCILKKLLLTYYLNISVHVANLLYCRIEKNRFGSENRIETFCLNWNALAPHTPTHARMHESVQWEYFLTVHMDGGN